MATATVSAKFQTLADLLDRLGDVPLDRIRFHPPPGTATLQDVLKILDTEGKICELVDGVLVEKVMAWNESSLAAYLIYVLNAFTLPQNLGIVAGADGTVELMPDLVRIPDVAFINWNRFPGRRRPSAPIPRLVPNLAVEVLSPSKTRGEMAAKRIDYFQAAVELVWEVDPKKRTVTVYTSPDQCTVLGAEDVLDGGAVLPGFSLPLRDLFAELDRQG